MASPTVAARTPRGEVGVNTIEGGRGGSGEMVGGSILRSGGGDEVEDSGEMVGGFILRRGGQKEEEERGVLAGIGLGLSPNPKVGHRVWIFRDWRPKIRV